MPDPCNLIRVNTAPPCFCYPELYGWKSIVHAVFTRRGGVSPSPYLSLNVAFSVGDRPENVDTNLRLIKDYLGTEHLIFMEQCHGTDIAVLDSRSLSGEPTIPKADALITNIPGRALMVKQADCQAIILFDPGRKVVANVHCGWRGNVQNIIGKVIVTMEHYFGCRPRDILAAVGPSLGPCCAEFSGYESIFPEDFKNFMVREDYFDLWEISHQQLKNAGVRSENVEFAGMCTRCRSDLFYSYRGEGKTGRFGTVAMLV